MIYRDCCARDQFTGAFDGRIATKEQRKRAGTAEGVSSDAKSVIFGSLSFNVDEQ